MNNSELLELIVGKLNISQEDFETSIVKGGIKDEAIIKSALENCSKEVVEAFLNGFIILKRGEKETKPGEKKKAPLPLKSGKSINNVILKKLKIAYTLTNEDMIDIYASVGIPMTKNDLTTLFRKEGHKHYRLCEERDLIHFLDGVAKKK